MKLPVTAVAITSVLIVMGIRTDYNDHGLLFAAVVAAIGAAAAYASVDRG